MTLGIYCFALYCVACYVGFFYLMRYDPALSATDSPKEFLAAWVFAPIFTPIYAIHTAGSSRGLSRWIKGGR